MSITAIEPAVDADDYIAGYGWLLANIALHRGIRLPKPGTFNIPLRGETRAEREADLREVARQWDAEPFEHFGVLMFERWFGAAVRVEAHISPQGESNSECTARMRAAHAAHAAKALVA